MKPAAILFFFLACWAPLFLHAQAKNELSEKTLLEQAGRDTAALRRLLDLAIAYLPGDSLKAAGLSRKAVALARERGERDWIAEAAITYAQVAIQHLQMDSAIAQLNTAIELFDEKEASESLAEMYLQLDKAWYQKMVYSRASEYAFKALNIYETTGNDRQAANCLSRIGLLLIFQESYQEGVDYCLEAIAMQEKLGAKEDMATSYVSMARGYLFVPDVAEALESVNKAIALYQEANSTPTKLADAYNTRGNVYKYLERYPEAEADYRRNLAFFQRENNRVGMLASHGNLGHVLRLQKQYEEALPHSLSAIELGLETGDRRNLWENYMHASIEYEMLGDFEKALAYNIHFSDERERLNREAINHLKSELQTRYETDKKNATIADQGQRIAQQRRMQALTLGFLAVMIAAAAAIFFAYRNNRRINRQLAVLNTRLARKNEENELLLKEIHHRVKNNLQVISSLLSLQSAEVQDETVLDTMRESQNRVRSMALIHQKLYQGKNLAAVEMKDYFTILGESLLDSFGVEPDEIQVKTPMEEMELDVDTAIPIGLIVNELVTNSMKYAFPDKNKGEIRISLSKETDSQLRLVVADTGDGPGEQASPQGTGFGSQLIQLLALQLNGKLETRREEGMMTILRFESNTEKAA